MVIRKCVSRRNKSRRSLRRSRRNLSRRHTASKSRRFRASKHKHTQRGGNPGGHSDDSKVTNVYCDVPGCQKKTYDRTIGYICKQCTNIISKDKSANVPATDTRTFEDIINCKYFRNQIFEAHSQHECPEGSKSFIDWTGIDAHNTISFGHIRRMCPNEIVVYTLTDRFLTTCPCVKKTPIKLKPDRLPHGFTNFDHLIRQLNEKLQIDTVSSEKSRCEPDGYMYTYTTSSVELQYCDSMPSSSFTPDLWAIRTGTIKYKGEGGLITFLEWYIVDYQYDPISQCFSFKHQGENNWREIEPAIWSDNQKSSTRFDIGTHSFDAITHANFNELQTAFNIGALNRYGDEIQPTMIRTVLSISDTKDNVVFDFESNLTLAELKACLSSEYVRPFTVHKPIECIRIQTGLQQQTNDTATLRDLCDAAGRSNTLYMHIDVHTYKSQQLRRGDFTIAADRFPSACTVFKDLVKQYYKHYIASEKFQTKQTNRNQTCACCNTLYATTLRNCAKCKKQVCERFKDFESSIEPKEQSGCATRIHVCSQHQR